VAAGTRRQRRHFGLSSSVAAAGASTGPRAPGVHPVADASAGRCLSRKSRKTTKRVAVAFWRKATRRQSRAHCRTRSQGFASMGLTALPARGGTRFKRRVVCHECSPSIDASQPTR
jgi:hypothetical protein